MATPNRQSGFHTPFKKITLNNEVGGFFALAELHDKIDGVLIQMIDKAQNKGFGSYILSMVALVI